MSKDLSSIHPELVNTARTLPKFRYCRSALPRIRFFFRTVFLLSLPRPGVRTTTFRVPAGDRNSVRTRVYRPLQTTTPVPVLLWFHGGGHLVGNLNMSDGRLSQYVRELGIAVVSVDYRLAPEHPFPADLDDAYTVLRWVHQEADSLGIDPGRIAVGGESAGGGLAASLAQRALDRGEVELAFQLLIYPMLDDRTGNWLGQSKKESLVWTAESNQFAWAAYLKRAPSETVPVGSVPARRNDLSGLPPAWIGVGTEDLFHDEDVAYAQRLRASGVDCELKIVPGAYHGFDSASSRASVTREFVRAQHEALRRRLFPATSRGGGE